MDGRCALLLAIAGPIVACSGAGPRSSEKEGAIAVATPVASVSPASVEARLRVVLDEAKGTYSDCLKAVRNTHPIDTPSPNEKKPATAEEARKRYEYYKARAEAAVEAGQAEVKCGKDFRATITPKLAATGADPATVERVFSEWQQVFLNAPAAR
jgi:hypothetical protein